MKILLVEDSRVLRDRLRNHIATIPHAVLVGESDNEAEAIRCVESYSPDTVVLDLKLKSGSGLSVLEHIHATHPGTTVVVLTNYGQAEYRDKCLALGATHFFDKSRDYEAFTRCLQALEQDTGTLPSTSNRGVSP